MACMVLHVYCKVNQDSAMWPGHLYSGHSEKPNTKSPPGFSPEETVRVVLTKYHLKDSLWLFCFNHIKEI